MFSLAEQQIFERAKRPLYSATETAGAVREQAINTSCGDEIELFFRMSKNKVLDVTHKSRGCAVSTASADLLCELLMGRLLSEAHIEPADLIEAIAIPLSPARLKCALLPLEALKKGLSSLQRESEARG